MDKDLKEHVDAHSEALIRELHAEMRAIREADLKMLPFFYASSAFVLPAHVLTMLNEKAGLSLVLSVAVPLFVFVCVMWWQLHQQLAYSHFKYRDLGERIQKIWEIWQVANFCAPREDEVPLGGGSGYKRAQLFLAATAICVLLILFSTTFIKVCSIVARQRRNRCRTVRSTPTGHKRPAG